jgi:hypothetical protein
MVPNLWSWWDLVKIRSGNVAFAQNISTGAGKNIYISKKKFAVASLRIRFYKRGRLQIRTVILQNFIVQDQLADWVKAKDGSKMEIRELRCAIGSCRTGAASGPFGVI